MKKILIALITLVILINIVNITRDQYKYTEETVYIVQNGDTLWGIAEQHSTKAQDTRKVVQIIREINGDMTPNIYEGQKINIPEFKK